MPFILINMTMTAIALEESSAAVKKHARIRLSFLSFFSFFSVLITSLTKLFIIHQSYHLQ